MRFDGAVVRIDGAPNEAPLIRQPGGWRATFNWIPAGSYRTGVVVLPDSTTIKFSMWRTEVFVMSGHLMITFFEGEAVEAEITRRMLALAA